MTFRLPGVRRLSRRLTFGVTASRVFVRASGFRASRRTVQLTSRFSGRVVERADFFQGQRARVGVAKRSASLVASSDFFQGQRARVAQHRTVQVGPHFFLEGQCCSFGAVTHFDAFKRSRVVERADFFRGEDARVGIARRSA